MAKIMVTGHRPERLNGRELEVTEWLNSQIRELQPTIAISGMAAGADQIYAELALKQRIPLAAADIVLAVWDGKEWGGTWNTIKYARDKGREIRYFPWK